MNIKKILSQAALDVSPYLWEEGISEGVLRFDTNTMPYPPKCFQKFLKSMKNCPINEYQDPNYTRLKELIAGYEGVEKDMISVTNSGDEAIDILAKTFLNPNEYFITTPPTYEMFEIQCRINKGRNLPIPLVGEGFEVDGEKIIKESKKPKVKIIFLVNPNNPTGSIIPQKSIEKILKNTSAIVVVDEVYREFYGKTVVPLLEKYENLVILRSFSKFAAIAGARVGYLLAKSELVNKFESIRFPMGVCFMSYKLAETVLSEDKKWMDDQIGKIKKERIRLTVELGNLGFRVYPSYANFLLVKIGESASDVCRKLKEKGIVVRDRSKQDYLAGCVRITVRTSQENNLLIRSIKEIIYEN